MTALCCNVLRVSHTNWQYRNEMTIPESLFDLCFLLCPYSLLLGLLFRHKAFEAPSLTTPELLSKLDIHPDEYELPLPLKESIDEIFIFRQAIKTAFNGYEISANKRMIYSMISSWMKRIGVLAGFGYTVILYTLHYTTANTLDQSGEHPVLVVELYTVR